MNDQQRAAMQMAYQALWVCREHNKMHFGEAHNTVIEADEAYNTLHEALAQPQEQSQVTTDYRKGWIDGLREFLTRLQDSYNHYWQTRPIALSEFDNGYLAAHGTAMRAVQYIIDKATNTAPAAQQEVTEGNASEVRSTDTGEPVACWMYQFRNETPVFCTSKRDWAYNHSEWKETPLYTTPPSAPNLNCKSVQKRLATSWGYVLPEEYTK